MHRCLIAILCRVDVRLVYAFAAIFVIPVCLITNASRRTAYSYFRRRMHCGVWRAAWNTYLNHCMFSQVVIDRFAMFAGKRFNINIEGYEHFARLDKGSRGFMMLSSHVGCYEVAGYSLVSANKRLNAIVFGGEKATVMQGRKSKLDSNNIRMIAVNPDMSHLFLINEALLADEIVSMPADRIVCSSKTVEAELLGAPVHLPQGPFAVATMRGLDVIAVNVMKTSAKGYTIYVAPLAYDHAASRRQQMRQLAAAYAEELQYRVRQYPTQWYNFFDFWQQGAVQPHIN